MLRIARQKARGFSKSLIRIVLWKHNEQHSKLRHCVCYSRAHFFVETFLKVCNKIIENER